MQLAGIAELGVGLNYQPQFQPYLEERWSEFDYIEIVPDIFWVDQGKGTLPRYSEDKVQSAFLDRMRQRVPVVLHSIGMSIGSAHNFDLEHVAEVGRWQRRLDCPWHSDHLAYHLADGSLAAAHGFSPGAEVNAGVTMPLRRDRVTLGRLVRRIEEVRRNVAAPFLIENNVYFVDLPGDEMGESDFLNTLCRQSGCGLVLDLHNVYCNSLNMGFDVHALLDRLDLSNVIEIHLGGGHRDGAYYLDSHSGPTPEPVWELLDAVLALAPNVKGIVFELFGSWYSLMGEQGLSSELTRMRETWRRYKREQALRWERCA